jgi:DNA-binding NarL/FixJ family response regulator
MACRIVLCDDHAAFRQVISIVLGLEADLEIVGEAADGREAIALVDELRPDVLVLDIAMPVMDGLEALEHLQAASPDTRVVMLTAVASSSIRSRALEGGAIAFIEKGADIEDVVAQIRNVCLGDAR